MIPNKDIYIAKTAKLLQKIDRILVSYKTQPNPFRQNWIANRLVKYIEGRQLPINQTTTAMIDVGGGNGNVLSYLATQFSLSQDKCVCVEQIGSDSSSKQTEFQYPFSHADTIQYTSFSDVVNTTTDNSVDYVLCMVSLHHMPDELLFGVVFPLINKALKTGGYLFLKEHNACSSGTQFLIKWEHYLYYLMEHEGVKTMDNLTVYLKTTVLNCKSRATYCKLLQTHCGCECVDTLNNVLEHGGMDKTPTNLYWQVFRKR